MNIVEELAKLFEMDVSEKNYDASLIVSVYGIYKYNELSF